MDCELYRNLLSSYIDKDINEIDKAELEKHLASCDECMYEYKMLLTIVNSCNITEEVELPPDFKDKLYSKIRGLSKRKSRGRLLRFNWKWTTGIAAMFIIAIISIIQIPNLARKNMDISIAPESASASEEAPAGEIYFARGFAFDEEAGNAAQVSESEFDDVYKEEFSIADAGLDRNNLKMKEMKEEIISEEEQDYDRKIIVSGSISIQVVDFDSSMKSIVDLTKKYGGYVENSYADNNRTYYIEGKQKKLKSGNISIRIPSDKFQIVLEEIKIIGETSNESTSSVDISDVYYDTATRVRNLKTQEDRLRELLDLAKNVDEILKIENELNRVRSDIELMSTDIKRWDKQVSMSSLYIDLREMKDAELSGIDVSTIWGRAYKGLIRAMNNVIRGAESLFIVVISGIPYIMILGVIAFIIYYFIKRRRDRSI